MKADHHLRVALLAWVQRHSIMRRADYPETRSLLSDTEAVEELLSIVRNPDPPAPARAAPLSAEEQSDWAIFAEDLLSDDPARIARHLPEWIHRPETDEA